MDYIHNTDKIHVETIKWLWGRQRGFYLIRKIQHKCKFCFRQKKSFTFSTPIHMLRFSPAEQKNIWTIFIFVTYVRLKEINIMQLFLQILAYNNLLVLVVCTLYTIHQGLFTVTYKTSTQFSKLITARNWLHTATQSALYKKVFHSIWSKQTMLK